MCLKYFGLTELCGESNTGKTALCIEESKKYFTMYLCTTNFPILRCPEGNLLIKLVQSLEDIFSSIKLCKEYKVELLVIDNLSSIVDTSHNKISRLVLYLKKMIYKYKLRVLVVNTTSTLSYKMTYSYKLGLEWEYQVNTRYKMYKEEGVIRLEIVKCPIELNYKYTIEINSTTISIN
ncbi:DNA repair RAD55-like protein [Vairimorpha necatrix]|uniref:DNA repair RAD55-like protein n=1 Tax=Vairimorpha necatrix TaxID=6039 RepID=A0AAX4JFL2_9MICR